MQLQVTPKNAVLTRDTETFGKMDPYVKFSIQGQSWKTKTHQNGGKTPQWNETHNFTINPHANSDLLIEIYDEETLKTDDFVGSTIIPNAAAYFQVGASKQDTLTITHQNKSAGQVNIVFYLTPAPAHTVVEHKETHSAPAWFLTVNPKAAQLTRDTEIIGKMDPYVKFTIQGQSWKTSTKHNAGKNPQWNDSHQFQIFHSQGTDLTIEVYDEDPGKDDLVGSASIQNVTQRFAVGTYNQESLTLTYHGKSAGSITIGFSVVSGGGQQQHVVQTKAPVHHHNWDGATATITLRNGDGLKRDTTHFAQKLINALDKLDPYIKFSVNGQHWTSSVRHDAGANATWNETSKFTIDNEHHVLNVDFFDKNTVSDDHLGRATFDLAHVEPGVAHSERIQLTWDGKVSGYINVDILVHLREHVPVVHHPVLSGNFSVTIRSARILGDGFFDFSQKLNPYVQLTLGKQHWATEPDIRGERLPIWNQTHVFRRSDETQLTYRVNSKNFHNNQGDLHLGDFSILIDRYLNGKMVSDTFLLTLQGRPTVELTADIMFSRDTQKFDPHSQFGSSLTHSQYSQVPVYHDVYQEPYLHQTNIPIHQTNIPIYHDIHQTNVPIYQEPILHPLHYSTTSVNYQPIHHNYPPSNIVYQTQQPTHLTSDLHQQLVASQLISQPVQNTHIVSGSIPHVVSHIPTYDQHIASQLLGSTHQQVHQVQPNYTTSTVYQSTPYDQRGPGPYKF